MSARPTNIILRLFNPANEVIINKSTMDKTEKRKALIPGVRIKNPIFASRQIDKAAPKADADEIPSVKGDAKGLSKIICIIEPASPRQAPAVIAINNSGRRIL